MGAKSSVYALQISIGMSRHEHEGWIKDRWLAGTTELIHTMQLVRPSRRFHPSINVLLPPQTEPVAPKKLYAGSGTMPLSKGSHSSLLAKYRAVSAWTASMAKRRVIHEVRRDNLGRREQEEGTHIHHG
jgi:hypothetical protein